MGKKNLKFTEEENKQFFSIFKIKQHVLNRIARREAAEMRRTEELRTIYLKRKAHYDKISKDLQAKFDKNKLKLIGDMIEKICCDVVSVEEKLYYRRFESLDDIVEFYKKDSLISEYKEIATIDFIAMDIACFVMPFGNWKIGNHIKGKIDRFELFQITNKDIIHVLEQIGFKKYFE